VIKINQERKNPDKTKPFEEGTQCAGSHNKMAELPKGRVLGMLGPFGEFLENCFHSTGAFKGLIELKRI